MTFDSLVQFLLEQYSIKDLSKDVKIIDISNDMERVETLFPYGYRQDSEDLITDSQKSGFLGFGIFDETDKIQGYILGHYLQEDDYDTMEYVDLSNANFYDNDFKIMILSNLKNNNRKFFKKLFHEKAMYVSNLVVMPQYRYGVYNLIHAFVNECRNRGIEYLLFDALPDTVRIIKSKRLQKYNIRNLVQVEDDANFYILKI